MILEVTELYKTLRSKIDTGFPPVFRQGKAMATKVGSQVSMPCIASRHEDCSNPEATSPFEHYKRILVIPFLDHIIMCIDQKCSPSAVIATSLLSLIPSIICSKKVDIESAAST